jgi:hypothetical protein
MAKGSTSITPTPVAAAGVVKVLPCNYFKSFISKARGVSLWLLFFYHNKGAKEAQGAPGEKRWGTTETLPGTADHSVVLLSVDVPLWFKSSTHLNSSLNPKNIKPQTKNNKLLFLRASLQILCGKNSS